MIILFADMNNFFTGVAQTQKYFLNNRFLKCMNCHMWCIFLITLLILITKLTA